MKGRHIFLQGYSSEDHSQLSHKLLEMCGDDHTGNSSPKKLFTCSTLCPARQFISLHLMPLLHEHRYRSLQWLQLPIFFILILQQRQQICPFGQEVSSCQCRVTQSTDIFDCYTYNRSQVDILFQPCTKFGIICLNRQQPGGRQCQDYELRFLCTGSN